DGARGSEACPPAGLRSPRRPRQADHAGGHAAAAPHPRTPEGPPAPAPRPAGGARTAGARALLAAPPAAAPPPPTPLPPPAAAHFFADTVLRALVPLKIGGLHFEKTRAAGKSKATVEKLRRYEAAGFKWLGKPDKHLVPDKVGADFDLALSVNALTATPVKDS